MVFIIVVYSNGSVQCIDPVRARDVYFGGVEKKIKLDIIQCVVIYL